MMRTIGFASPMLAGECHHIDACGFSSLWGSLSESKSLLGLQCLAKLMVKSQAMIQLFLPIYEQTGTCVIEADLYLWSYRGHSSLSPQTVPPVFTDPVILL